MTDAEFYQQQLDQQKQLSGTVIHDTELYGQIYTEAWKDDDSVFVSVCSGVSKITLFLPVQAAKVLADQIFLATKGASND